MCFSIPPCNGGTQPDWSRAGHGAGHDILDRRGVQHRTVVPLEEQGRAIVDNELIKVFGHLVDLVAGQVAIRLKA